MHFRRELVQLGEQEEAARARLTALGMQSYGQVWDQTKSRTIVLRSRELLAEYKQLQDRGWFVQQQQFCDMLREPVVVWRHLCETALQRNWKERKAQCEDLERFRREVIGTDEDDERFALRIAERDQALLSLAAVKGAAGLSSGLLVYGGCPFRHQYDCPYYSALHTDKTPDTGKGEARKGGARVQIAGRLPLNAGGMKRYHYAAGAQYAALHCGQHGLRRMPPERVVKYHREGYLPEDRWQRGRDVIDEASPPGETNRWRMGASRRQSQADDKSGRRRSSRAAEVLAADEIVEVVAQDNLREEQRLRWAAAGVEDAFEEINKMMKKARGKRNIVKLSHAARSIVAMVGAGSGPASARNIRVAGLGQDTEFAGTPPSKPQQAPE
eukprot:TRINITY_DN12110_c0_g1_i3.p2 TRINITY_DN12110_c0_g1~~TRINITY_DN12110_c0_g1_i3.p2  ORF type:complete len:384 (+),score=118.27 TRINITY_DN12110_c0_g1_i3:1573-2724(+)